MARRPLVALLTAMLLAFPGGAFAQSAGDDQYEDPFGSGQEQEQPAAPEATPEPSEPAPAAPAETETAPAAEATPATAAASSQEQLPNTGLETGLVAAAGALLIGAGVTLRARSGTR